VLADAGDRRGVAFCRSTLGLIAGAERRPDDALGELLESLRLFRLDGSQREAAAVLSNLGNVAQDLGDHRAAARFFDGGLQLFERLGDRRGAALCLNSLSMLAHARGDLDRAVEAATLALEHFVDAGDRHGEAAARNNLGGLWEAQGATAEAARHYEEAVACFERLGDPAGAATARHNLSELRPPAADLSPREVQVAELVAAGLSNRVIAERLFISQRTVDSHLSHIFTKLGMSTRTQLALWAVQHGLAPAPEDAPTA
jgi:DNA-binding CsgD family transcriptional regulator